MSPKCPQNVAKISRCCQSGPNLPYVCNIFPHVTLCDRVTAWLMQPYYEAVTRSHCMNTPKMPLTQRLSPHVACNHLQHNVVETIAIYILLSNCHSTGMLIHKRQLHHQSKHNSTQNLAPLLITNKSHIKHGPGATTTNQSMVDAKDDGWTEPFWHHTS